ncbi:MAG: metallophosphoesterase [Marinilabiliales bacterium]|nr:MAG: metallophosphoesterase [Marinilabiliales bacterium]
MSLKIACLSDTHGYFDKRLKEFIGYCDEIWHAGDIGSTGVAEELSSMKPLRAVHGNIDGADIRASYPEHQRFSAGGLDVWITHIGGYPGRYDRSVVPAIFEAPPGLFICGHSHILKVINDSKLGLLHINPGAAGRAGAHKVQTAVRFVIEEGVVKDLEVAELERTC